MMKIYSILNSVLIFLLLTEFFAPQVSALMVRKSIEELTSQADSILIGKVKKIESRWNEEKTLIYTYVTVSVKQHTKNLSGVGEVQEIIVKVPGGEVGDIGLKVSDSPQFREGEEVFLFLRMEKLPLFSVVGLFQGKYTIEEDRVKNRILGLEVPLDSFISQIKGILQKAKRSQ
ncbi:hypothetical protein CEE34_00960 [Candidatus Aerophobetes bacterium Ae_b3a]|nr:MAG: hypothetical protein CEE34_00960 [Candidatus Aerophobetes bacterium Ae_b3a]